MAMTSYTLQQVVHFAEGIDGDITGATGNVLVLDSLTNTAIAYNHSTGAQLGTPFYFTVAQANALITAGWLAANPGFTNVPSGKAGALGATGATGATGRGYTAGTGWTTPVLNVTAGAKAGTFTSGASTLLPVANALAALISDLTAAGIIGV